MYPGVDLCPLRLVCTLAVFTGVVHVQKGWCGVYALRVICGL